MPYRTEGKKVVLFDHPDYRAEGNTLEFRLTYEGELHSSGNNSPNATEKHTIRKVFHQQLKHLWEITPHLRDSHNPFPGALLPINVPIPHSRREFLAANFSRCGFNFVPLVTKDLELWCGIDILFLRAGPPGKVFEHGDVDNRFKTILDALKLPEQLQDLGDYKDKGPYADESPFFAFWKMTVWSLRYRWKPTLF